MKLMGLDYNKKHGFHNTLALNLTKKNECAGGSNYNKNERKFIKLIWYQTLKLYTLESGMLYLCLERGHPQIL